jgi:hypothetical protein
MIFRQTHSTAKKYIFRGKFDAKKNVHCIAFTPTGFYLYPSILGMNLLSNAR